MSAIAAASDDEGTVFAFSKVPLTTASFWGIKILTTAMGEAVSDYLRHHLGLVLALSILSTGIVIALAIQLSARRYRPPSYWFLVAMVAVFGTTIADGIHKMGVPVEFSAVVFAALLAAILFAWQKVEGTLSVHSIFTRRREYFYWLTVMASFTLGTAAGDWTAGTLGLGNFYSGVLFLILFVLPAVGYRFFGLNSIAAFWFSYIMTRPLGASFADWIAKPARHHDLGYGTGPLSVILIALIILWVGYLTFRHKDREAVAG